MANYNLSEYNDMNKANTNQNQNQNITKLTHEQTMLFNSIKNITKDITYNMFNDKYDTNRKISKPKQKLNTKQFFTGDVFLFEYKFLDSHTFNSYLSEFERLLSEVHLIISKQNTDKVQTLQIKLNQLKDQILYLRK
jgi:hypothetical protein